MRPAARMLLEPRMTHDSDIPHAGASADAGTGVTVLHPRPLTPAAFAPFGRVVAWPSAEAADRPINGGTARRQDIVPDLRLDAQGGRAALVVFRAQARTFPLPVHTLERHALGSQTFIPLGNRRFVVLVAPAGDPPGVGGLAAFVSDGAQGVCLYPGVWHHALLAVEAGDFAVIERVADVVDCDTCAVSGAVQVALP